MVVVMVVAAGMDVTLDSRLFFFLVDDFAR